VTQEYGPTQDELLDEAAAWIARLRSDAVSHSDKVEFSRWLNQSDAHTRAFDEMADTWDTLGAAAFTPTAQSTPMPAPNTAVTERRRHWLPDFNLWQGGLAMACIAGLVAIITLLPGAPTVSVQTHSTAAGEQRQIALPDGSVVELNTQSTLQVAYTDEERNLVLVKGEVYFDVFSNKQRPFVVNVGSGTITAVGTAFNIYRQPYQTLVTVTEGIVRVKEARDATTPSPASVDATADQQVTLGRRGLSQPRKVAAAATIAWLDKTLVFDDIPLPQAIEELNRYLEEPVDASDTSLIHLKVSGTFSLEAPGETLQALVTSFNLATDESGQSASGQRLYLPNE